MSNNGEPSFKEELKEAQIETLARLVTNKAFQNHFRWWRVIRVVVPIVVSSLTIGGGYVLWDLKSNYSSLKNQADSLKTSLQELRDSMSTVVDEAVERSTTKVNSLEARAGETIRRFDKAEAQTNEQIKQISELQLGLYSSAQRTLLDLVLEIDSISKQTRSKLDAIEVIRKTLQDEVNASRALQLSLPITIAESTRALRERISEIEECRTYLVTESKRGDPRRRLIAQKFEITIAIYSIKRKSDPPITRMFASPIDDPDTQFRIHHPRSQDTYTIGGKRLSIQVVNIVDLPNAGDIVEVEICELLPSS